MAESSNISTILKSLSDPGRMRILSILNGNELTVKEMVEILGISQSTLSSQLSQLKDQSIIASRKEGQFVYYRRNPSKSDSLLSKILKIVDEEIESADWYERDQRMLLAVLELRREASLAFFNSHQNKNTKSPGQTWQALSYGLIDLIRDRTIVDMGCGNGRLSALFARSGNHVIGIDNSKEQIQTAEKINAHLSREKNLRFIESSMENTGLDSEFADLVIISQALHHIPQPEKALKEAQRILKNKGNLLILDLLSHNQDWIKDRFGDFWFGFALDDLETWLDHSGFHNINSRISSTDPEFPQIESLIVIAEKK